MNRQALHALVDIVDDTEIETLYRVLIKFVPEDTPTLDEIKAINEAHSQFKKGEYISHQDINWD